MKQKKNYLCLIVIILVASFGTLLVSCGDDHEPDPMLGVSPENLLLSDSGEGTLTITSNTMWYVSTTAEWLTFSTMSGVGNGILTVQAKDSRKLDRTATVTLKGENISCHIVVTQVGPQKYFIYGDVANFPDQTPFRPGAWYAAAMRFSSTDGEHFPTISDEIYFGLKTLIFDVSDVSADFDLKVMNGWWSNTYYDHVKWVSGLNKLQITETMAKECAQGGEGRDLDLMLYSGICTINAVYYEE